MAEEVNLSDRLSGILEEIKDVMEQRRQRIEELRQEISSIEHNGKGKSYHTRIQ